MRTGPRSISCFCCQKCTPLFWLFLLPKVSKVSSWKFPSITVNSTVISLSMPPHRIIAFAPQRVKMVQKHDLKPFVYGHTGSNVIWNFRAEIGNFCITVQFSVVVTRLSFLVPDCLPEISLSWAIVSCVTYFKHKNSRNWSFGSWVYQTVSVIRGLHGLNYTAK